MLCASKPSIQAKLLGSWGVSWEHSDHREPSGAACSLAPGLRDPAMAPTFSSISWLEVLLLSSEVLPQNLTSSPASIHLVVDRAGRQCRPEVSAQSGDT